MQGAELTGAVFAGCRVERSLGRGGMGAVYFARHESGEPRVVKVLAAELAGDPALRERFQREGRALQKVPPHPHVVRVYAAQEDELLELPFLVMEYVPGPCLGRLLHESGPLPPGRALTLARDVARGLVAIHAQGLVHRDIKPNNLLLGAGGEVKIVDLGLAKDAFQSGLTAPGRILGTVAYMAPEQWEGRPAGPAADLFALGATLYELLVGQPPFRGQDLGEVMERATSGDYTPVGELLAPGPGVAALDALLSQLLEPELRFRYGRADECLDDLERLLRGEPPSAPGLIGVNGARRVLLGARRWVLGSAPEADVRLVEAAPRHARLRRGPEGFVLNDLVSGQATLVDGAALGEEPRLLRDGARLLLGRVPLVFEDPRARAPRPPRGG